MSLGVAILTAATFALFGYPLSYYMCWFSWSKVASVLIYMVYLGLAGGGGGFIGWLAAEASHAKPTQLDWLNGILFGAAGALALRADFSQQPAQADLEIC